MAERAGETMDCLSNNADWLAPVLVPGVSPAPDVMLDSAPSALPYALLALQYAESRQETLALGALDVLEDLPATRALTVTVSSERTGAVIGTTALEARLPGDRSPRFTVWVRSNSRVLYSVEAPAYRFGLWQQRAHPGLRHEGRLVIQRVSRLPELPTPAPAATRVPAARAVEFRGGDGGTLRGSLALPEGNGPFPCLVVHSRDGVAPRYDATSAVSISGWAVFAYDKRGVGDSAGTYDRGPLRALAEDALLAAQALAARPEIDAGRIVLLALGDGGRAGALALGLQAERGKEVYAGAVLGSAVTAGQAFPALVEYRAQQVMARFYNWDVTQLAGYRKATVEQWRQWLFERQADVTLLRRKASLRALNDFAAADVVGALAASKVPVLLLEGDKDTWTPLAGAQEAVRALNEERGGVELWVLEGADGELGGSAGHPLGPQAEQALGEWLARQIP